jgi:hypothetical protein
VAQATYRVQITNAAGTVTYADSGVLSGTNTSWTYVNWAETQPSDTTGNALRATVTVTSADGSSFTATHTVGFDVQWGVVTCTITSPADGAILREPTVTVTWSFASTRGKTQGRFRVRLRRNDGLVIYDSGWVSGTNTSWALPVLLQDHSTYLLGVQLKNTEGVPS